MSLIFNETVFKPKVQQRSTASICNSAIGVTSGMRNKRWGYFYETSIARIIGLINDNSNARTFTIMVISRKFLPSLVSDGFKYLASIFEHWKIEIFRYFRNGTAYHYISIYFRILLSEINRISRNSCKIIFLWK